MGEECPFEVVMSRSDPSYNLEQWDKMAEKSCYSAKLLSKELHISRRQVERYTKKAFGLSPQRWLHQQRLIVAGKMLTREHSIKSVCYQLGFKWPSHFSRGVQEALRSFSARISGCRVIADLPSPGGNPTVKNDQGANLQLEFVFK